MPVEETAAQIVPIGLALLTAVRVSLWRRSRRRPH
jgi:hypothetical protein